MHCKLLVEQLIRTIILFLFPGIMFIVPERFAIFFAFKIVPKQLDPSGGPNGAQVFVHSASVHCTDI